MSQLLNLIFTALCVVSDLQKYENSVVIFVGSKTWKYLFIEACNT